MNKIITGFVILLFGIQLIPVNHTNPSVDATLELKASNEVLGALKNSCYDCHSHETKWPRYSYIAPISWLVKLDVIKGRKELNFSEWNQLSPKRQLKLRKEIVEEVEEGKMPMRSYLITHPQSKLSKGQIKKINDWAAVPVGKAEED